MDNAILHRRRLVVFALVVALALAVVVVLPKATTAAPSENAGPPEPAQPPTFTVEGACDFPVLFEQTYKVKFIDVPGEDFMLVFPPSGGTTTLTNLDEPENQVTVGGGGKGRVRPLENGEWLVKVSGHNILVVPDEGIFEVRRATFTLAPPFEVGSELTILESRGKLVDLCAALA
jgi:hypothetical protein